MAEKTITGKFIQRNDTKENWDSKNPILSKGEIGIISDDNDMKLGDGVSNFNTLKSVKEGVKSIKDKNSNNDISVWIGTQEEYIAIQESLINTICIIS